MTSTHLHRFTGEAVVVTSVSERWVEYHYVSEPDQRYKTSPDNFKRSFHPLND